MMAILLLIIGLLVLIAIMVGMFFLFRWIWRLFRDAILVSEVLLNRSIEEEKNYQEAKEALIREQEEKKKRISDEHYEAELKRIFKRER